MGNEDRKQALWLSRNRAFRALADENVERYRVLRDRELARLGEPPLQDYSGGAYRVLPALPPEEDEQ